MDTKMFKPAVFIAVVLFVAAAAGIANAADYQFQQIAVLQYGSADNQLGILTGPEVGDSGPASFWIANGGQIYILDSLNQAVKKISPSGQVLSKTDIGIIANDLVVDDNGDIFVYDPTREVVEQISADGQCQGQAKLSQKLAAAAFTMAIDDGDVVFQTGDQAQTVLSRKENGKTVLLTDVSEKTGKKGMKGLDGRRFKTKCDRQLRQGLFCILDDNGQTAETLVLPVENVLSIALLGQDKKGNSYLQVETRTESGVALGVYCLDNNGNIDSVIENMPNNYDRWTAKLLQVDGNGDIYQMLPTRDSVQINVWKRQ